MKKFRSMILVGLALTLSMSLLAGCGKNAEKPSTGDATQGDTTGKDTPKDEEIVLTVMDWSDSSKGPRDEFHEKFMAENPNVKIEYTLLTGDQFKNTVMTQIKSGDAPDLFPIPTGMKLAQAVAENWYLPLDDYLTDEFMATVAPEAVVEGYTMLNDTFYTLPENIGVAHGYLYYNKDLLAAAGYDPETPPATWSEFREVAKAVTEAGDGQYFGMIEGGKQLNRLDTLARSFATVAGAKINVQNTATIVDGKTDYNSPEMIASIGLLSDMVKDGSFHPDTMSISAPEARAIFGQGQAAFLAQGIWSISTWRKDNPDLNFGAMAIPVPDDGAKGAMPSEPIAPWMGISSNSKHPEMAAKYLMELYGEDYQGKAVADGTFVSIIPAINEKYMSDEVMLQYYNIAKESKLTPNPITRDPIANDFYAEVREVQPSFGAIIQGVLAGGLDNYEKSLNELNEGLIKEWNRAADKVGMDISVLEYPNWDPTKDYTPEMYEELK